MGNHSFSGETFVTFHPFLPEAREYIAQPEIAGLYKAVGMIVGNVFSRVIGSFVLGFVSNGYPVKMFTNREKLSAG
ncbi:MAG: hypothetical protein R3B93_03290 [Bacteroidia bacterium]